ncbi:MAG: phosphatidylserine decarboxylase family protein [Bacteroidaceae bacterium]|nr:phosphatidylserine decarboxylase family protein [Bacteroidaceae bacterium]MBQ8455916.1 phosphatidylserine decarboxylase family protein [Bacteroidaceae bacterium]MBQ9169470.1 phosphatidylserine decarboxylase family protein [Bacteroidaceae bacterium]MBQ9293462.1 phosphatidylserine decarboxylase family protein [Bacteroidaceae bacterium]
MGKRFRKLKKIRLHHEGKSTLLWSAIVLVVLNFIILHTFESRLPFDICIAVSAVLYGVLLNFFQCPIRTFEGETEGLVVAPCDGKVVVVEETEENEYFHDRRVMVSIFMSLFNVHANWIPVDGTIKEVQHFDGNFHKAWLPKASDENEHSLVVIETPDGTEVLARQVAGAMARRIVTYPIVGEECYVDEHLGFIKFGSRVDLYLPLGTEVMVKLGQKTVGNETVVAKLKNTIPDD